MEEKSKPKKTKVSGFKKVKSKKLFDSHLGANLEFMISPYPATCTIYPDAEAISTTVPFAAIDGYTPIAAWVGDFKGGDFAQIAWSLQDLSRTQVTLWAQIAGNSRRVDTNVTVNIIIMWAPGN